MNKVPLSLDIRIIIAIFVMAINLTVIKLTAIKLKNLYEVL